MVLEREAPMAFEMILAAFGFNFLLPSGSLAFQDLQHHRHFEENRWAKVIECNIPRKSLRSFVLQPQLSSCLSPPSNQKFPPKTVLAAPKQLVNLLFRFQLEKKHGGMIAPPSKYQGPPTASTCDFRIPGTPTRTAETEKNLVGKNCKGSRTLPV